MEKVFDYLENVALSATVCDKTGIVLYQNRVSIHREGNVLGKNLFNCHNSHSNEKIRHMLETGDTNTYETIKKGKRFFIYHTPWYEEPDGDVSGLIEFVIDMPETHLTYNRDKE